LVVACGGDRPTRTCAEPEAAPIPGDSNGDGRWDIADGVYVARHRLAGGPAPVCEAAAEVDPAGPNDLGDVTTAWYAQFVAAAPDLPPVPSGACATPTPAPEAPCGKLGLALSVDEVNGSTARGRVLLTDRDLGIEAWSLGLVAEGCTFTAATTVGTVGADGLLGDGQRKTGFEHTSFTQRAATSAVVLDWSRPVSLSISEEPAALLVFEVLADGGCSRCEVALADAVDGAARPVDTVLVHAGRSYRPKLRKVEIEVCR
jgi:hypothetical protein